MSQKIGHIEYGSAKLDDFSGYAPEVPYKKIRGIKKMYFTFVSFLALFNVNCYWNKAKGYCSAKLDDFSGYAPEVPYKKIGEIKKIYFTFVSILVLFNVNCY